MDTRYLLPRCVILVLVPIAMTAQVKRLAVYDFDYRAVRGDVGRVYGSDKPVGAQVANRLIAKLVNSRENFDVIDRNQIDRLMREQNQKFSDRFDPRDAPKLGKLLNVDAIITGSVDQLVEEMQNNRVGVGPIGLGKAAAVSEVTVSVRVISTETGRIFLAEQVTNKHSHSLGKSGRYGNSGSENGSSNAHPGATAANVALQGAADDIASKIISKASSLPVRGGRSTSSTSPPPSTASPANSLPGNGSATRTTDATTIKVGRVDGNKIYLTGGENAGVKVNDYFEVRHVTGTMKGDQGNIETDERVETIVVTDVQEKFAVAKVAGGAATPASRVGDKLKRMKAPQVRTRKPASEPTGNSSLPAPVQRKP